MDHGKARNTTEDLPLFASVPIGVPVEEARPDRMGAAISVRLWQGTRKYLNG